MAKPIETVIASPQQMNLQWGIPSHAYAKLDDGTVWGPSWPISGFRAASGQILDLTKCCQLNAGEGLQDFVQRISLGGSFIEIPILQRGQCYRRIWRGPTANFLPGDSGPYLNETPFTHSFIGSLEQLESLFRNLGELFRVSHPAPDNLNSYGSAIRDLLILACTEVEAQWKAIAIENHLPPILKHFNTKDYVKLLPAMKLNEYGISLLRYPGNPFVFPFNNWNPADPTQSLDWYNAYNQVKHDREAHFKEATLGRAIYAVAACLVLLAAQFGEHNLRHFQLESPFHFQKIAHWEPKEWYYRPLVFADWDFVDCPL